MQNKKRILILGCFLFGFFSLLIMQYFKIQIIEVEKWSRLAQLQHQSIIPIPFQRGSFYAAEPRKEGTRQTPQPLVLDVTKFHLYIDPLSIPSAYREEMVEQIALFLEKDPLSIKEEFQKKSRSRKLAPWLERSTKKEIAAWWYPFAKKRKIPCNALYFLTDYKRSFPFGKMLGQVLHTIRDVKEEKTLQGLPTGGLESHFNELLRGKKGKRRIYRTALNPLETDEVIEKPIHGADIYLTIDPCIQTICEEELEKGVHSAQAKSGWAVMMDPKSGEIVALAQYPFFDPSEYKAFFNDPEKIQHTKIKAIQDAFELGSIMKPLTLSVALQANCEATKREECPLFDPEEKIDVTRTRFPGRFRRPLKDPGSSRSLNMNMALQRSSNVYMAQLMDRVVSRFGAKWYRNELVDTFGLGRPCSIELPSQSPGMVPTPGKKHPNGALEWSVPTPYSLAMGYNLRATSLQMLRAYAVIANGGYLIEPTIVKKIVRNEKVLQDPSLRPKPKKVLDSAITKRVVEAMKFTTKPGGTGARATIYGYSEAGKTGTAEKLVGGSYSKKAYISSFIGIFPANQPLFVLIVTLDEPAPIYLEGGEKNYLGGRCAAPIFGEIGKRTLEYLGVPPDDPYGYPPGDPRYNEQKADWIQQVNELKRTYETWHKRK